MMQLAWNILRNALQPIKLRELARALPVFAVHIAKASGRKAGLRQRERMQLLSRDAPP